MNNYELIRLVEVHQYLSTGKSVMSHNNILHILEDGQNPNMIGSKVLCRKKAIVGFPPPHPNSIPQRAWACYHCKRIIRLKQGP